MNTQFWTTAATVFIALISAAAAYASQRAASRASQLNTNTTSRVDMEKEAYMRARKLDTETIQRQDAEILELLAKVRELEEKVYNYKIQTRILKVRVEHLEKGLKKNDGG